MPGDSEKGVAGTLFLEKKNMTFLFTLGFFSTFPTVVFYLNLSDTETSMQVNEGQVFAMGIYYRNLRITRRIRLFQRDYRSNRFAGNRSVSGRLPFSGDCLINPRFSGRLSVVAQKLSIQEGKCSPDRRNNFRTPLIGTA